MKISIIGAGNFGTALTTVATRCNNEVTLWAHEQQVVDTINSLRSNPLYLPNVALSENVRATNDLAEAAAFSETILMVVPSHHFRDVLKRIGKNVKKPVTIVSATKGIENKSLERMSQISAEVLGDRLKAFAALSGPTFAVETATGQPTAAVIASKDSETAQQIQQMLSSTSFRLYHSDDVVGVELAGSLKNVIAIAAGVLEGLGLGYNTTAALITRGLHEITRLGMALGGKLETFAGLAGMGDLVLTCTGGLSRNRSVGVALGRGKALAEILAETREVAEGIKTAKSAKELADRHRIEMPITAEMYRVLYENESPRVALQRLMSRSLKAEAAR